MSSSDTPKRAVMFTLIPVFVKLFETLLQERGHKLVGVVTAPGPRTRRSEEYREVAKLARPGLDVVISNYPNRWAGMVRTMKPDLIFCAGSNWVIPADVIDIPPLGMFNGHDSVLPRNRGKNSSGWALRTGEPGYGVSFHRMTPQLDDGPILAQREVTIGEDDDYDDVWPAFFAATEAALNESLDMVLAGEPGTPQDPAQVTYTGGGFEPEWRYLDWHKPVRDVFYQLRSWCGIRDVPRGAFGEFDGQQVLITKAKPASDVVVQPGTNPGTVISRSEHEILIACTDGALRIMAWQDGDDADPASTWSDVGFEQGA